MAGRSGHNILAMGTASMNGNVRSPRAAALKKFGADGYVREVERLAAAERG